MKQIFNSQTSLLGLLQNIYRKEDIAFKIYIPEENMKTNTQRGRPHMNIALLADGRPRITGLEIIK